MSPEEVKLWRQICDLSRKVGFYRGLLEGVLSHDIDEGLRTTLVDTLNTADILEAENARKDN